MKNKLLGFISSFIPDNNDSSATSPVVVEAISVASSENKVSDPKVKELTEILTFYMMQSNLLDEQLTETKQCLKLSIEKSNELSLQIEKVLKEYNELTKKYARLEKSHTSLRYKVIGLHAVEKALKDLIPKSVLKNDGTQNC